MVRYLRWTEHAIEHLTEIVDFLETKSPVLAQRVATAIYEEGESLVTFSHRGTYGPAPGTHERVIPSHGYILTYEVIGDAVFILGIHHGAQDKPRR